MKDEALKLAQEALELVNIEFVCNGAHHAKKDRHELGDDCPVTARYQNAITAIKAALAQPAQEQWNAALDEAAARIGEIKGFGQATQDSFAVFIQGLKR